MFGSQGQLPKKKNKVIKLEFSGQVTEFGNFLMIKSKLLKSFNHQNGNQKNFKYWNISITLSAEYINSMSSMNTFYSEHI